MSRYQGKVTSYSLALGLTSAILVAAPVLADIRAFPTAEGKGRDAAGGRHANAYVIYVTTLNDNTNYFCAPTTTGGGTQQNNWEDNLVSCSPGDGNACGGVVEGCQQGGPGTLRRALNAKGGKSERYIIPRVSGLITLNQALETNNGWFTFLGHLAPTEDANSPGGITVTRAETLFSGNRASEFVMRYFSMQLAAADTQWIYDADRGCDQYDTIRFWNDSYTEAYCTGDFTTKCSTNSDCTGNGTCPNKGPHKFILDHTEMTGGSDEIVELLWVEDYTIQRSVIANALHHVGICTNGSSYELCDQNSDCASNDCDLLRLCKSGLGALTRRESTGSFVKNFWGYIANRFPKDDVTSGTVHTDHINNFTYGTNEGNSFESNAQPFCTLTLNYAWDDNGLWNVIGNYFRPGPECRFAHGTGYVFSVGRSRAVGTCSGTPPNQTCTNGAGSCTSNRDCWGDGPQQSHFYIADNILDPAGGTGNTGNHAWVGWCNAGDNAGLVCRVNEDCPNGNCSGSPCPVNAPCDGWTGTHAFNGYNELHLEGSPYSFDGEILAANLVDDEIVVPGTRDVGPNYPVERDQLKLMLDDANDGRKGEPMICDQPCLASTVCPDGTQTAASDKYQKGKINSGMSDLWQSQYMHNCTQARHKYLDHDVFCGGSGCTSFVYPDADMDGIDDSWESIWCNQHAGATGTPGDCSTGNSTTECDNANWTSNGYGSDTTVYPCIELFAYEKLGEVTSPTAAPECGNDIKETGEDCDGTDDDDCPGECTGSCTCPPPAPVDDFFAFGCYDKDFLWQVMSNGSCKSPGQPWTCCQGNELGTCPGGLPVGGDPPYLPAGQDYTWATNQTRFELLFQKLVDSGMTAIKLPIAGGADLEDLHNSYIDSARAIGLEVLLHANFPQDQPPDDPCCNVLGRTDTLGLLVGDEPGCPLSLPWNCPPTGTNQQLALDELTAYYEAYSAPGTNTEHHTLATNFVGEGTCPDGRWSVDPEQDGQFICDGSGADFTQWWQDRIDDPQIDTVKFARWYGLRQDDTFLTGYTEIAPSGGAWEYFQDYAEGMESQFVTGEWWGILQAFGDSTAPTQARDARLPTANEMKVQIHLLLSYGVRAIYGYTCQQEDVHDDLGLLDQDNPSIETTHWNPTSHSGISDLAPLVTGANAGLFLRHVDDDTFTATVDNVEVHVTQRTWPDDDSQYVYVTNLNTDSSNSVTVNIPVQDTVSVRDVFTGLNFAVDGAGDCDLSLNPGQGMMLKLTTTPGVTPPPGTVLKDGSIRQGNIK